MDSLQEPNPQQEHKELNDETTLELEKFYYSSALEMLVHEDDRKSHLFTIFFLIQGAFFAYYSLVLDNKVDSIGAIIAAFLAMLMCAIWFYVLGRMSEFIKLRRSELVALEEKLSVISLMSNEKKLRGKSPVKIGEEIHELPWYFRGISISGKLESAIPFILGLFWLLIVILRLNGFVL